MSSQPLLASDICNMCNLHKRYVRCQVGFTFLVPAHLDSPDRGALNGCVFLLDVLLFEIVHCCIRNSVTLAQNRFLVDDYPLIIAVVLK